MEAKDFEDFFSKFKTDTEVLWENKEYDPRIFGYQIQRRTKWLSGYSDNEVEDILSSLGIENEFRKAELRIFLKLTKGLSLPQINLNSQEIGKEEWQNWKLSMNYIKNDWKDYQIMMERNGEIKELFSVVGEKFKMLPIFAHRVIVLTKSNLRVYSIYGDDIIVYGESLRDYLIREFQPVDYFSVFE